MSQSCTILTKIVLVNILETHLFKAFHGGLCSFLFGDLFFIVGVAILTSKLKTPVSRGDTELKHHLNPIK